MTSAVAEDGAGGSRLAVEPPPAAERLPSDAGNLLVPEPVIEPAAPADDRPRLFDRGPAEPALVVLNLKPVLVGELTSTYGMRRHPILGTWVLHEGIDWSAPRGTPVFAAADGAVSFAGWEDGYGYLVRIIHAGGVETAYAHLSRITTGLAPGVAVTQGTPIGLVGSTGMATGPHLHFEVRVNGALVDPLAMPPITVAAAPAPRPLARLLGF